MMFNSMQISLLSELENFCLLIAIITAFPSSLSSLLAYFGFLPLPFSLLLLSLPPPLFSFSFSRVGCTGSSQAKQSKSSWQTMDELVDEYMEATDEPELDRIAGLISETRTVSDVVRCSTCQLTLGTPSLLHFLSLEEETSCSSSRRN
jgi:hypothetical protein